MAADQASATPVPTTEDASGPGGESSIPDQKWQTMQDVLTKVYNHRIEDGYDPSKIFHRKINKRQVPDYYEVIKEPMALSMIKQKIHNKEYKDFPEYVRDFTLITYNAQVYNRQDSQAYQDALVVKEFFENEVKRLVEEKVIDEEEAKIPYLGEIPTYEDPTPEEVEDDEDEEEEEDEEEVDDDDDDDDERPKRRRAGPRSNASILKREGGRDDTKDKAAEEARKRRGRPPRVDTPMEARIKAIMKAIRKHKNDSGQLMVSHFERIPDKSVMPEYFMEIKNPMAMDVLKKKLKRKKYQSVDQFMKDVELMFENAKQYNEDESQIYKDACFLQKETRKAAEEEKAKPDTEYVMEDGRIPLPDGILLNGELWKVGDWVHIRNANDLTKPIVAQIYRTWQDSDGGKWVNACWYYRPEQTVHRFDRHFYENEVVKTGQYRDHPIDEVVDRCFVMFFTRYNKGRPRGFPLDKEIYVCEARYNEEKHKLNKIKTWASCLPDEVRDKDYEMDLFDVPKRVKKIPSPIQYLLKDDAKESDDLPEPEWGAPNAPPKIGAVHKRPRDPKESPPPEPTPSPPPQAPPPPQREPSTMSAHAPNGYSSQPAYTAGGHSSSTPVPAPTPQLHHTQPAYTPQPTSYHQHSASPAPPMQSLAATHPASFPPQPTPHHPSYGPAPTPHTMSTASHLPSSAFAQQMPSTLYLRNQQAAHAAAVHHTIPQSPYAPSPAAHHGYKQTTQQQEVYRLDDHTNATIPQHLRDQFQQDEQGRLLLFTAPPLDVLPPLPDDVDPAPLGHSAQYLAARKKRAAMIAEKRKREEEAAPGRAAQEATAKKARIEQAARDLQLRAVELAGKATGAIESHLAQATVTDLRALYGEGWKDHLNSDIERLLAMQQKARKAEEERREREREREERERERVRIEGLSAMLN
ncbi:chromatin structure-remodeling complex protein-like protein rsc1 [Phyllosticta capitalensis]